MKNTSSRKSLKANESPLRKKAPEKLRLSFLNKKFASVADNGIEREDLSRGNGTPESIINLEAQQDRNGIIVQA